MSDLKNSQENITTNIEAKKFETPASTIELLLELQHLLSTNNTAPKLNIGPNDMMFKQSQSKIWFEEDSKVLEPLLKKLQKEFSFEAIGIIQKAAPGYYNEYIIKPTNNEGEYDSSLQDSLREQIPAFKNKDSDSIIIQTKFIDHEDKVSSDLGSVVLPCSTNNNLKENLNEEEDINFGYLGIITTQQQAWKIIYNEHDKGLSQIITIIANQLGIYFSHLYLTRKIALNDRLKETIEAIDTRISNLDNPKDATQILKDLAIFISEVFDQKEGAIYTYIGDKDVLEKTASLDPWKAAPVTIEQLRNCPKILDALKKAEKSDPLDNTNREINLPISYIFPLTPTTSLTSTPSKYSRALVIFDSELNHPLTKDEIVAISDRLEEKIGFHLQEADNEANRISSITEFKDIIKNISDPNVMQDKMIKVISDHLNVGIISYMEVDPSRKYLILKKGQGHSNSVVPNETKQLIEDSISGLVVKYGKTLYIKNLDDLEEIHSNFPDEDIENLERLFKEQHETTYHTKSLLSVPLITGIGSSNRKVTGVINVNNKENKKSFSLSDKRFLEEITDLVAEGINNVGILSETQERELLNKNAREIQMSLMPTEKDFKRLPQEIDMYGESIPAKEVGGDLFETVKLCDGRLLVLLGDVSGKGSSAAIIMAIAQTIIKTLAHEESNIINILKKANKYLSAEMEEMDGKFVTLQLVAIDISTGECEFASAGHGPLLVRHMNKNEKVTPKKGMPLGLFDPPIMPFESISFKLAPGDSFVMFTDGLYEEINHNGEMFGTERISDIFTENSNEKAETITKALISACQDWREGADAHDDLTVLTIKYRGKGSND
ncbi:MAG: SpoIIE family protein phosphatase [Candidatus Riflebacteria bacterium]|nr:SpoIIE family protein phosphatase [Candidatus Riflebacteria bacterium]